MKGKPLELVYLTANRYDIIFVHFNGLIQRLLIPVIRKSCIHEIYSDFLNGHVQSPFLIYLWFRNSYSSIFNEKGAAKEIIINAAWELFQEKRYDGWLEKQDPDENRPYFQILYALLREALQRGELKESKAAYDQARVIGEIHRGLTYSWLLSECRYSLTDIVKIVLKTYIDSIRA